jgi:hypothetical protein
MILYFELFISIFVLKKEKRNKKNVELTEQLSNYQVITDRTKTHAGRGPEVSGIIFLIRLK